MYKQGNSQRLLAGIIVPSIQNERGANITSKMSWADHRLPAKAPTGVSGAVNRSKGVDSDRWRAVPRPESGPSSAKRKADRSGDSSYTPHKWNYHLHVTISILDLTTRGPHRPSSRQQKKQKPKQEPKPQSKGKPSRVGLPAAVKEQKPQNKEKSVTAPSPLDSGNKGFQLLMRMGWSEGQRLGRREQGMVEPVGACSTAIPR